MPAAEPARELEPKYTYADALNWPEELRIELIYGEPVMMAPPSRKHQEVLTGILMQLGEYLKGKTCKVYPAPFAVRLFEKAGDSPGSVDTMVEPDITLVCDPGKLDDAGCIGAPDLIVEILSPSTRRNDQTVKFKLYQKAGVKEYWIVDADARIVSVYELEEGAYHAATVYSGSAAVPVVILEDCKIDLNAVFPDA